MPVRLLLRAHAPHGRRRGSADGGADAREDGGGRHVRPARRAASTAIRPTRAGWCRTSRRCCTTTRCSIVAYAGGPPGDGARRLRARRARDARLPAARDDRARGRLLFGDRRRLQAPDGKSEEGTFFVWSEAEIRAGAGRRPRDRTVHPPLRRHARTGTSRARTSSPSPRPTARRGAGAALAPQRAALYAARARRSPPFRDDKILAAWNGLTISAAAVAGRMLDERRYVDAAVRAATFVLEQDATGRAARAQRQGRTRRARPASSRTTRSCARA